MLIFVLYVRCYGMMCVERAVAYNWAGWEPRGCSYVGAGTSSRTRGRYEVCIWSVAIMWAYVTGNGSRPARNALELFTVHVRPFISMVRQSDSNRTCKGTSYSIRNNKGEWDLLNRCRGVRSPLICYTAAICTHLIVEWACYVCVTGILKNTGLLW